MDRKDQVSHVNASWTNQLAFSAEHAFFDFMFQKSCFTPEKDRVKPADIKIHKMAGCTGCGAAAAPDANPERRFERIQVVDYPHVLMIIIELAVGLYRIAEIFFHFNLLTSPPVGAD